MPDVKGKVPSPEVVLGKAILRAAKQLGLKQSQIAAALGITPENFGKLKGKPYLVPTSKQGELALLIIRIAQSLSVLTGSNESLIKRFMHSPNKLTGGIPAEQIATIEGMMLVLRFVQGIRNSG